MKTCKDCQYKAKNRMALNAFECAFLPPVPVPMQSGAAGQLAVAGVRPPVQNDTAACNHHSPIVDLL